MRINTSKTIQELNRFSHDQNKTISPIFKTTEWYDDSIYIGSAYKPQAIIWYDESGDAFVDLNPQYKEMTGNFNTYGGLYYHTKHFTEGDNPIKPGFTPVAAYYIPSEDLSISRFIEELNLAPLNKTDIQSLFNYLNLKLETVNKQMSSWDTLNIYRVVHTIDELSEALSSLPLSSSIVANIDDVTLKLGEWSIAKGDTIIKDVNGELHLIKGAKGGYYFPSKVELVDEKSTLATISFSYSQENPEEDSKTIDAGVAVNDPSKLMTFNMPTTAESSLVGYGYRDKLNGAQQKELQYTFDSDNKAIEPIIYYYYENERIIFPEDYEKTSASSTTFKIKNPCRMQVYYEVR